MTPQPAKLDRESIGTIGPPLYSGGVVASQALKLY